MESMPLRDRLYMPPIERYEKYGKYPWRMVVDILLLVFTTSQLLLIVTPSNAYANNQINLWRRIFVPDPAVVYGISELQGLLRTSMVAFSNINSSSFDNYEFVKPTPVLHAYHSYNINDQYQHSITAEKLGPLENNPKEFLRTAHFFFVEYEIKHVLESGCYIWRLKQQFSFENYGPVSVSLKAEYEACFTETRTFYTVQILKKFMWLHGFVLVLAILAMSITVRSFLTRIDIVAEIRGDDPQKVWGHLEFQEKLRFFPLWMIVTATGNLAQFFGCMVAFVDVNIVQSALGGLIGLGCFCSWVSIMRYFENSSDLFTLVNTVKRCGRILLLFIVGVAPVFVGYIMLGMSFLSGTGYFNDVPSSIAILYAVMCGDTIYDLFMAAGKISGFFGRLFVLSYIIFFIACVHNIFIAIIQEGFYSLKTTPPKNGAESSEEEEQQIVKPQGRVLARLESKKKSRETFKRLMTEEPLLSLDEEVHNTEDTLKSLQRLHEDALSVFKEMESTAKPSVPVDQAAVEKKLKEVKTELIKFLGSYWRFLVFAESEFGRESGCHQYGSVHVCELLE